MLFGIKDKGVGVSGYPGTPPKRDKLRVTFSDLHK